MVKRSVCFILTFVMIVCSLLTDNSVYAASKLTTLKVDKVYKQFDLDHDGKNEELLFKEHEVPEWEEDMCDYLSVYVNGKKILNVKGIYYKEQYSILLVQMQKKYFLYVNLWGDDGVGPILIYKYEQGAFTKVFDGNKLSDKFGYWGSIAIQSVDKNKIKIRLSSMSYAVASIELEAKLKYKDGKLVLASKMCKVKKYYNREEYSKNSDLYKKDRKPYLTVARDIQLYKTCNKKSKSFIVKRGEKAKILKCYIGNKHVMYQIKTLKIMKNKLIFQKKHTYLKMIMEQHQVALWKKKAK